MSGRLKPVLDIGGAWNSVRAILVTVDGKPLFEKYYHSTSDDYHNVFSITKSVLSTLIGKAEATDAHSRAIVALRSPSRGRAGGRARLRPHGG
jgi:hypothetical protein